jgi:hypothetical protein
MRAQPGRRAFTLCQERQPIVDDVVGEHSAVGVFGGFGWIERQHVGQGAFFVDSGDGFLTRVVALRAAMSNVEIVVEDEPPDGRPLLGLYRGVPLPSGPSPPPADPRAPSLTAYP